MKTLFQFLISIWYCWGTLVVKVPFERKNPDIKTVLTLNRQIEIASSILFCIRFQFKSNAKDAFIFGSEKRSLALRFDAMQLVMGSANFGEGFVTINGNDYIFKIPQKMFSYEWHHFCFNSDMKKYQVLVDGVSLYKGSHNSTLSHNMTIRSVFLGSNSKEHFGFKDFEGEIASLNIWGQSQTLDVFLKIVESCGNLDPIPDKLDWSNITSTMFNGTLKDEPIKVVCHNNGSLINVIHKLIPYMVSPIEAIRVCENLKAELAYPKFPGEYKEWSGKFKHIVFLTHIYIELK